MKLHEPRILDAVRLRRRIRKDRPLRQTLLRRKCEFVVRFAECENRIGHRVEFAHSQPLLAAHRSDGVCNCSNVNSSSQQRHHLFDKAIREAQLDELPLKQRLFVLRVRSMSGVVTNRGVGSSAILQLLIDRAGAKRDRRHVPFAGRPQADDEPLRTGRQARLIRMPHHRRIEQRRRFERVLLRKITADEQLAVLADGRVGQQELLRVLEAMQDELPRLLMPAVKLGQQVADTAGRLPLRSAT